MTAFTHDEAKHLPSPGGELLWAIRTWVIGTVRQVPVEDPIRDTLSAVAAPEAADLLFGLMWVVGQATSRKLTIACACHPGTTPDEQLLLDTVAFYQAHRPLEAMLLLRSILPPRAALAARDSADGLAAVLAERGYWLDQPARAAMHQAALVGATVH